ncbi:hypothetical protein ACYJGC_004977 [Klebsiella pneumoniae]|uniref:hypothetical protein n=1 Tax=Klebsiella pneumoniae TaxID=573 RepID=UPI001CBBC718|nr:hypothetical protein [Klebsiella pneumoniae]EKX7637444.1 hypothetical protein [Klebsiella pneumoniae]ELA1308057.1 hypothetical protein [Klebsiella pneumoniae]MBZ1696840.1 hypothetical protein [Klebsiella pneumoniae]HDZ2531276.1 hypothetical protein [Klebsiella pneumoniae]HDZ2539748.1 hypothetical protein [Klebsiella pneumoniae]
MRRYTVILSDHAGYVDYHVQADTREVALERAIKEHCAHDTEEEKEEREKIMNINLGLYLYTAVGCDTQANKF